MNDEKSLTENNDFESNKFDDEQELRRLIRSIKLAERYYLFFASCNQIPRQNKLIKRVKKELHGYKIQVIKFDKPIENLLDELRKKLKNKKPDAVFVQGLRYSIPSSKKAKQTAFIANLNVSRDSFPKFLSCPLILWLPEYAIGKIINGAPDFFSVRSGVFFFETDAEMMSQQISQAISTSYQEHDALLLEERQQRIENLKELLAEYQSLLENKRDLQTEYQLKDKLANIYYKTANFSEAERLIKELLKDARQKNDGETAKQLNQLALVYRSQGKYDEATELYKEALLIDEKTIGKEHPDYATNLNNLANVYHSQGKYDEAIELYKEALLIDEKTIGKEHPGHATRLNNLANVYHSQGKYDEAIELFQKALLIIEKTVGKKQPNYASGLNNLALAYKSQGRYDEAIELYKEALLIDEKTIGKEHPDYAIDLNNLANVYYSQGKYENALSMYEEALKINEKSLPENHHLTQMVKKNLEDCREALKKKKNGEQKMDSGE